MNRVILGDPHPWDALDLPFDQMKHVPGVPRDRDARPSLDVVLALRKDRMATVRRVIDDLTDDKLDSHTTPVPEPGWPPSESFPRPRYLAHHPERGMAHRLYAERDLAVLETTP